MNEKYMNQKILLNCFICEFIVKIWNHAILYSEQKNTDIDTFLLLKSLKFNLFCPSGTIQTSKSYLIKCLKDGFLLPNEFNKNRSARRAIMNYSRLYEIQKYGLSVNKFICEKILKLFKHKKIGKNNPKIIQLCNLMDNWDIRLELLLFSSNLSQKDKPSSSSNLSQYENFYTSFVFINLMKRFQLFVDSFL